MAQISMRMDDDLKKQAEALFDDLGLSMSAAFTVFVKQSLRQGGIPFEITTNPFELKAQTIAAMQEANEISKDPTAKKYSSFSELLAEVEQDV